MFNIKCIVETPVPTRRHDPTVRSVGTYIMGLRPSAMIGRCNTAVTLVICLVLEGE